MFEHYFYYPAPHAFSEEDLTPLRDQLNVGLIVLLVVLPTLIHSYRQQACFPYQLCISNIELEDHAAASGGEIIRLLKINLADHRKCRALKDESTTIQTYQMYLPFDHTDVPTWTMRLQGHVFITGAYV